MKEKDNYIRIIPCVILLLVFSLLQFHRLKEYYDELLSSTGLVFEDFDSKVREENERARQEGKDYQKLLQAEGAVDPEADPNITLDNDPDTGGDNGQDSPPVKLKLRALSSLLMDASNNRVLYEENGYREMPMASTTKIMTCIVTLENANLKDTVTISSYASRMPDVQLNIKAGEQYLLRDLLYSLMLESHNDTAVAIAEHVGGSVEGFAAMMNDTARRWGCEHTNFVTPNGLDAENHYTTARDLAVIASYAIRNPQFLEITNTSSHSFQELKSGRSFTVTNKNRFLYMMEGAIGVKTGFTSKAGYCFVGAVRRQNKVLISVVLGSGWPPNKNLKWTDTKALMGYGIDHYEEREIFQDVKLDPLFVKNGQVKYEGLSMKGNLSLLMRKDEQVSVEYVIPEYLEAPVQAGSAVGEARYSIDGSYYTSVPIYAVKSIEKIDYPFCLKKVLNLWNGQYLNAAE